MKRIFETRARSALMGIIAFSLFTAGCNDESEAEPDRLTDFVVISDQETSNNESEGGGPGEITVCALAPRYGTLVIGKILGNQNHSPGRAAVCASEWKYTQSGFQQVEIDVLHSLGGAPALTENRLTAIYISPYSQGSWPEVGETRFLNISPEIDGDHFLTGVGYEIAPASNAAPQQPGPGATIDFPTNVSQLRTEIEAFMTRNDPLPTTCPNYNFAIPSLDESRLRNEVLLEDGESLDGCDEPVDDGEYTPPDTIDPNKE